MLYICRKQRQYEKKKQFISVKKGDIFLKFIPINFHILHLNLMEEDLTSLKEPGKNC